MEFGCVARARSNPMGHAVVDRCELEPDEGVFIGLMIRKASVLEGASNSWKNEDIKRGWWGVGKKGSVSRLQILELENNWLRTEELRVNFLEGRRSRQNRYA